MIIVLCKSGGAQVIAGNGFKCNVSVGSNILHFQGELCEFILAEETGVVFKNYLKAGVRILQAAGGGSVGHSSGIFRPYSNCRKGT